MRSLAKLCEPLLLFARRTIAYLKDTVNHEFFLLTPGYKTFETYETKNNNLNLSRKNLISEWIAIFVFCAVLVCTVVFFYKYPKDEVEDTRKKEKDDQDEEEEQEEREEDEEENEMLVNFIMNDDELTKDHNDPSRNDCGDSSSIPYVETISSADLDLRNTPLNFSNFSESTSAFPTQSNLESVATESNNRIGLVRRREKRHTRNERDWFLRRTRSGQIYGKYPM